MQIHSVSYISLSQINEAFPDFYSQVDVSELIHITYGDANYTMMSMSDFISFLTDMCNDDILSEDLYDDMYDALNKLEGVYVDLEN
jgi:hypothetical protein